MNRSNTPLAASLACLAVAGCQSVMTSVADKPQPNTVASASRTWKMDFETGLPALRVEANTQTISPQADLNDQKPIAGAHDLKISAILRGQDAPGWTGVWLPLAANGLVDAHEAVGIRFKAKSPVARQLVLILDSDTYASSIAKYAVTLNLAPSTAEYTLYFSQFAFPAKLYQEGGACSLEAGGAALCQTRLPAVLGRLRAIQGFVLPRAGALGAASTDTVFLQMDDLRFLFEEDVPR